MVVSMAAWCTWRLLAVINHVVMFGLFLAVLIWSEVAEYNLQRELVLANITGKDYTFMGEWKYLTRWDHLLQILFFFLAIVQDINQLIYNKCVPNNEDSLLTKQGCRNTYLNETNDVLYHCFALPLSIVVSFMYWTLRIFAPYMLSYAKSDKVVVPKIPVPIDHATHTLVLVACLLELFLFYRKRPNWKLTILSPSVFLMIYITFATLIRYLRGFPIYQIINNPWITGVMFLAVPPLMALLSYLITVVHNWFWTEQRIRSYQKSPKELELEENKTEA